MKGKSKHLIHSSALISCNSLMFAYYTLFSNTSGSHCARLLLPWIGICLVLYFFNVFFFQKGAKISSFMIGNITSAMVLCIAGYFFFAKGKNFIPIFAALAAIIASVVNQFLVAQEGVKPNQMLLYTEFTAFTLIICLALGRDRELNIFLMISFCFNFLSLILLRLTTKNDTKVEGSRYLGIFAFGVLLLFLGGMVFLLSLVFSHGVQQGMAMCVVYFLNGIRKIGSLFFAFLSYLFSFIPFIEKEPEKIPEALPEMAALQNWEEPMDATYFYSIIGIGILLAGIGIFFYLLRKNKGKKVPIRMEKMKKEQKTIVIKNKIWEKWKAFFHRIIQRIKNIYFCIRYPKEPVTLLLRAESYGRKKGMTRKQWETGSSYLKRLLEAEEEVQEPIYQDIEELSECLNCLFFSTKRQKLNKETVIRLRKLFR